MKSEYLTISEIFCRLYTFFSINVPEALLFEIFISKVVVLPVKDLVFTVAYSVAPPMQIGVT